MRLAKIRHLNIWGPEPPGPKWKRAETSGGQIRKGPKPLATHHLPRARLIFSPPPPLFFSFHPHTADFVYYTPNWGGSHINKVHSISLILKRKAHFDAFLAQFSVFQSGKKVADQSD